MSDGKIYSDVAKIIGVRLDIPSLVKIGKEKFAELGIDFETTATLQDRKPKGFSVPTQEYPLDSLIKALQIVRSAQEVEGERLVRFAMGRDTKGSDDLMLMVYESGREENLAFYIAPRMIERGKSK